MKYLKKFNTESDRAAYIAATPFPPYPYVHYVAEENDVVYGGSEVDIPLYIESLESLSVKFSNTYEYSRDGIEWIVGTSSTIVNFNAGEKVYFRASGLTASSTNGIGNFSITGTANIGGNIMSMHYGEDYRGKTVIEQSYAFRSLFSRCKKLNSAKNLSLPATTLSAHCYAYMFSYCTNLANAPELPATTLAEYCYHEMFKDCTSLVNAPELPATILAEDCYRGIFTGCTSLTTAPELPVTTLATYCYYGMFSGCTSLATAPELPATTLTRDCYESMFYGCSNLNYIKAMFTTRPSTSYTTNWVNGVASSGTFVKNAAATWDVTGVDGIPEGWTIQVAES